MPFMGLDYNLGIHRNDDGADYQNEFVIMWLTYVDSPVGVDTPGKLDKVTHFQLPKELSVVGSNLQQCLGHPLSWSH